MIDEEVKPDQRFITTEQWKKIRFLEENLRSDDVNVRLLHEEIADALLLLMRENRMWRTKAEKAEEYGFTDGYNTAMMEHLYAFD